MHTLMINLYRFFCSIYFNITFCIPCRIFEKNFELSFDIFWVADVYLLLWIKNSTAFWLHSEHSYYYKNDCHSFLYCVSLNKIAIYVLACHYLKKYEESNIMLEKASKTICIMCINWYRQYLWNRKKELVKSKVLNDWHRNNIFIVLCFAPTRVSISELRNLSPKLLSHVV